MKSDKNKVNAQTQVYTLESEREEFRKNCTEESVTPSVKGRQLIKAYNEDKRIERESKIQQ